MKENIKTIICCLLLLSVIVSCKTDKEEPFEINKEIFTTFSKDNKCIKTVKNGLGVDSLMLQDYRYQSSLLGNFLKYNENKKYTSFTFLSITYSNETMDRINFSIGEEIDKQGEVINLTNNKTSLIKDYDYENFINDLKSDGGRAFTSLFAINFTSNDSCICTSINSINTKVLNKVLGDAIKFDD